MAIIIETHNGIHVLRDDLLIGGTKSILMPLLDNDSHIKEFVYASPVYGGFQIALSAYCKSVGKKATIFCAKRNLKHANTLACIDNGANIIEVYPGYLTCVEKKAREYCIGKTNSVKKIAFGAKSNETIELIAHRTRQVIHHFKQQIDEIWVAVGSGTLITGILQGLKSSHVNVKVFGVQVGADIEEHIRNEYENLTIITYPKPFEYESKLQINFKSMKNYDLKAFELCLDYNKGCTNKTILFWNVM